MGESYMRQLKLTIVSMIILVMIAVSLSGCTTGTNVVSPTPAPSASASDGLKAGLADNPNYKIEITGGTSPATVTFADLKAMDFVEKDNVALINSAGTEKDYDYVGVPMMAILAKAGLPAGELSFKVVASDGYSKVYTRAQIENGVLGLKENGTPLTDNINKNSIRMVMPGEPGDMWMKVPVKIEIVAGASAAPDPVALNITGVSGQPIAIKMSKLQAYPVKSLSVPYKNNQTLNASGLSLNKLLDDYAANTTATKITFIAADGYNKTVNLADVRAAPDAIVVIDATNATLRDIIPGQAFGTWVDKLITIKLE
jgi:DMSO/TMAO reductase YedYZ molybdopterin-dependent catalytic subunit